MHVVVLGEEGDEKCSLRRVSSQAFFPFRGDVWGQKETEKTGLGPGPASGQQTGRGSRPEKFAIKTEKLCLFQLEVQTVRWKGGKNSRDALGGQ